jgi:hypothetical protein
MNRRTFITIAIGVLFAALMVGLWWWFFAAGGAPTPTQTGTFGTASQNSGQGGSGATLGQPLSGSVTAARGTTLTLADNAGTIYTVDASGATVTKGGSASSLASVMPGDTILVQGTMSGTSVTASSIIDQGPLGGSGGTGGGVGGSGTPTSPALAGSGGLSGSTRGSGYGLTGSSPTGVNWLAGGNAGSGGNLGGAGYGYGGSGLQSGTPTTGGYNPYGSGTAPVLVGTSTGPLSFGSGGGTLFTPAQINDLNTTQVYGNVSIVGTNNPNTNGNTNNGLSVGLVAGTAVACSAFLVQGQAAAFLPSIGVVKTGDTGQNTKSFMDCLMRTIARAALQTMTNSIVQWINSGFNGSPSFVTNYQQFFASVADQAAGSFLQNYTNFAPLCTPFQQQLRVALAQSYARRNATAPSCTLSRLLGTNTQGLFSGRVNGWNNLLQYTTIPSNNPYASYMGLQTGLNNAIAGANQNANRNMTQSGFLNFQQPYQCQNTGQSQQTLGYACPAGCKCRVSTPGSVIESSLANTLNVSQSYLTQAGVSGSFDAIINALITQLMQRALYNGLSSATPTYASGLTFDQQAAQAQGQYLLTQLQGLVTTAQQFGQTQQGSIRDIESTQQQLSMLANCWQGIASTTGDAAKQQTAARNASSTLATLHGYDAQVASLNADITRANGAIATLQGLQTKTLAVGSTADVAAVQNLLNGAQAGGLLVASTDLTQAQQDRTSLQSQLASVNQTTQAGLQQCNAFATN